MIATKINDKEKRYDNYRKQYSKIEKFTRDDRRDLTKRQAFIIDTIITETLAQQKILTIDEIGMIFSFSKKAISDVINVLRKKRFMRTMEAKQKGIYPNRIILVEDEN